MNLNTALSGAASAGGGAMGGLGGAALPMPSGQSLFDSLGGGTMELSARSGTQPLPRMGVPASPADAAMLRQDVPLTQERAHQIYDAYERVGGGKDVSNSPFVKNSLAGGGLSSLFQSTTEKYGLPQGYLDRTAQIESSGNPRAKNPHSSAAGLFQFTRGTAKQYGLTNPFDAAASTNAAGQLAADNARMLRSSLGREPTAGELYLAHQQGAGGAFKLLSNPNAPAVDAVGRQAVLNNGGNPNMTAGEFANKWISKYDKGDGAPQSATFATASTDLGGFAGAQTGKTDDSNPLLALLGGAKDGAGDLLGALGGSQPQASAIKFQSSNNPNKAPTLAEYVAAYLKTRRA